MVQFGLAQPQHLHHIMKQQVDNVNPGSTNPWLAYLGGFFNSRLS
jgi:hypothetical protein